MKKIAKIILIAVAVIFGLLLAIGFLADDKETQVQSPSSVDGSNEMQKESGEEESVVEESREEERSGGDNEALNESSYGDDRLEDARLDPGRSASGKIYFVCNDSDYSVIEAQINNAKWILKDADSELSSDIEADEEELDIYGEFYVELPV